MKLYATITSERASKGQGGNKQLHITITREINGERKPVYFVGVWDDNMIVENLLSHEIVFSEKGKKQKDKIGLNKNTYPKILKDWENRQ